MDTEAPRLSPLRLLDSLGSARAPLVIDARRRPAFDADPRLIAGVTFTHRGERSGFDAHVEDFGLSHPALDRLATIMRGAVAGERDAHTWNYPS
jgi:hypothetical protein